MRIITGIKNKPSGVLLNATPPFFSKLLLFTDLRSTIRFFALLKNQKENTEKIQKEIKERIDNRGFSWYNTTVYMEDAAVVFHLRMQRSVPLAGSTVAVET